MIRRRVTYRLDEETIRNLERVVSEKRIRRHEIRSITRYVEHALRIQLAVDGPALGVRLEGEGHDEQTA